MTVCCQNPVSYTHLHYHVPKYVLPEKMSGIFEHRVLVPTERLLRGFNDVFFAPHSRHTEVRASEITKHPELRLLSVSDEAGVYIVEARNGRQIFVLGHSEYDRDTLKQEYFRDLSRGLEPQIPDVYKRQRQMCGISLRPLTTTSSRKSSKGWTLSPSFLTC